MPPGVDFKQFYASELNIDEICLQESILDPEIAQMVQNSLSSDLECLPLGLLPQNSLGFRLRVSPSRTFALE